MNRPNFIIILCDDLGYGDLSCYGSPHNRTPRLDAMAQAGMRFTDFYMGAPLCSPSRAALMTGCYPKRIGLATGYTFPVLLPGDPLGLHPQEITLAAALRELGYATKLIGKWHLGDQPPFLPTNHGFDAYFGLPYSNDMLPDHPGNDRFNFPPLPLMRDDQVIDVDPNQVSLTDHYVRNAVGFLRANRDRPFFLYLSHMYVHEPIYAPYNYLLQSQNGAYGAAVEHLDHGTGVILDTLQELGLDDNTLVIFTSDNGSNARFGGSNRPLRGAKGSTWEGGMREPCIMHWPDRIPPGTVCSEVATAMDLWPTLVQLGGGSTPDDRILDGKDIRSLLFAEAGARSPHEVFFYYQEDRLNAVRAGRWKLHLHEDLLFDLEEDIGESQNVYPDHPHVVERLQRHVLACRQDLGDAAVDMPGENCREVGTVPNPRTLTTIQEDDPYLRAAYD